jgi:hypothetical protein
LYELAEKLTKQCSWFQNNLFKKGAEENKKNAVSSSTPSKASWAKIQNASTVEKVRQILEGKQIDENNPDDYTPYIEEDPYDY